MYKLYRLVCTSLSGENAELPVSVESRFAEESGEQFRELLQSEKELLLEFAGYVDKEPKKVRAYYLGVTKSPIATEPDDLSVNPEFLGFF